jgi:hypothetical protein
MWQWILNNVGVFGIVLGVLGVLGVFGIAISLIALVWSIWSYYHPKESSPWSMLVAGAAVFGTGSLVGWLVGKKLSNVEPASSDNASTKSAKIQVLHSCNLAQKNSE